MGLGSGKKSEIVVFGGRGGRIVNPAWEEGWRAGKREPVRDGKNWTLIRMVGVEFILLGMEGLGTFSVIGREGSRT